MNRRKAREHAFIAMFSYSFQSAALSELIDSREEEEGEYPVDDFGIQLLSFYADNAPTVDAQIESKLKGWKANRLPRVSLAVLRLAAAELLYGQADMDNVVINEAVELAKRFGDEQDYQFINGVLGAISRDKTVQSGE